MTVDTRLESELRAHYAGIPATLPEDVGAATGAAIRRSAQARVRPRLLLVIAATLALAAVAALLAVVGSPREELRPSISPPPATASSSPSASGSPSAVPVGLGAGTIATARREIAMPTNLSVSAGQTVFVVVGPVDHGGVPSYLIQHYGDPDKGFRPDGDLGWITAATAEENLAAAAPGCPPDPPDLAAVAALQPFARLVCFGGRDLTFGPVTASDYAIGARISRRWLSSDGRPDFFTGLAYVTDAPGLGLADGQWATVTGHFDAPSAAKCGDEGLVAFCREQFHVSAIQPVGAPEFVLRGTWRPTRLPPINGRAEHAMVWTGSEAVIWGGFASSPQQDVFQGVTPAGGAAYDPAADRWRKIPSAPIPGRAHPLMAWTGSEVLVFGGWVDTRTSLDGAAWNPLTNKWRKIAESPLSGVEPIGAWLAGRLIVVTSTSAASYDPATDRWTELPPAPVRVGWQTAAVAAGRLFVVAFGDGATPPVDWAVLDPLTATWASGKVPIDPTQAGVVFAGAGDEIVVTDTGLTFDPLTATWVTGKRCEGASGGTVWTGRYLLGITAAWDTVEKRCLDLPPAPPREPPFDGSNGREFPVAVWTGSEYITWSGGNGGDIVWVPKDGAVFKPDLRLDPAFP
jgi:hypothetical protein